VQRPALAPLAAAPAPAPENANAPKRCRCWGRVLAIRSVDATATAPASFEFTVRMHDGSLHTSPSTSVGSWRVGDRILVFGGAPWADDATGAKRI
jgi:hypothetical protein